MIKPAAADSLNTQAQSAKEALHPKTKPEKDFPKILDDKMKEEVQTRLAGERERQFNPMMHFLYDLAYRDPATWSMADRQQYHVETNKTNPGEIFKLLSGGNLLPRDLSAAQWAQISRLNTKEEMISFLDSLRNSLSAQAQNTPQNRRTPTPFSDLKTSLQEITHGDRVRENQIVESLIRQMALRKLNASSGEVRLSFNPEALGDIKLHLLINQNELVAHFETANAGTAKLLTEHLGELNQAFEKQGLTVKSLDVATQNSLREELYV